MLKLFYRLKRKHGAVLFFVVAVMSLLIAMATTAYYTARSSYRTVVSNYDYSQLYLSAISVSDMVMDAVTNETSTPYVDGDSTKGVANNYSDLRSAMIDMAQDSAKNNGTAVSPIVAKSDNIKDVTSTDIADIMKAAAENPIQDGIIDGVTVTIDYIGTDANISGLDAGTHYVKFYYTIETVAYYRGNTITVKDTLYNTMEVKVTNGGKPTPPNPVNFSRFFTATGQQIIDGQIKKGLDRAVIINTHEISDDAYFENKYTFFSDNNASNAFLGGISSNGSVFLDKFTCAIPDPEGNDRNDWFIGEDLVIMNANANGFNLGKNNLYIKGDLYLPVNCTITADNIFVGGNVYLTGGATSTITGKDGAACNLYIGGNGNGGIYYTIPPEKFDSDIKSAMTSAGYSNEDINSIKTSFGDDASKVKLNGNLSYNGSGDTTHLTVSGTTSKSWNAAKTDVEISVKEEKDGEFKKKLQSTNVSAAITNQTGTSTYDNYTSKATAVSNELNIVLPTARTYQIEHEYWTETKNVADFGNIPGYKERYEDIKDSSGKVIGQQLVGWDGPNGTTYTYATPDDPSSTLTGTVKGKDGGEATVVIQFEGQQIKDLSVDVQYYENGYMLGLENMETCKANANFDYNFHTNAEDDVQQVVLKSNFTDASGNASFSWKGPHYDNNGASSEVTVDGGGNLALEMGNIDKDGNYIVYDSSKTTSTVVYYSAQKEAVGTPAQLTKLNKDYQNFDPDTILDENSKPLSGYENKVMLISNKNGGTAVNGSRIDNTFFGIMYAPNADYTNKLPSGGNTPIVGGLVAARYDAELAYFYYSEPDPDDLRAIFGSLGGDGGSTPVPPGPPSTPTIEEINEGPWESMGSNYIG